MIHCEECQHIYCPEDCSNRLESCPIGIECPPILTRNTDDDLCEYYESLIEE